MTAIDEFKTAQTRMLERFDLDVEERFLEIPAVHGQTHLLRHGAGPPVVMVPGFADPTAMWTPLMAELTGYTFYAVDRPCFGLTGRSDYTTANFRKLAVDFLEQVLDGLGLARPMFVGNSIGSLWSIWLAIDRPERVAALVSIGCPAFMLGTSAPLPMRLLANPVAGPLLMKLMPPSPRQVEQFAKKMAGEDLSEHTELRDLLLAAQKMPDAGRSIRELLHAALQLRGARREVALSAEDLTRVRRPALFIWGTRDAFGSPDIGREAIRLVRDAELKIIDGGGHVPWIGHPAEVAAAAAPFLRAHS
jgi:pimeloyl-ACP methyl ester carboxylesterase